MDGFAQAQKGKMMNDLISRQASIDCEYQVKIINYIEYVMLSEVQMKMRKLPSAQPEIIRCKDCEYGEQDEVGRWFCRSLGCQIGNEDGSGYCADAERRTG